MEKDKSGYGFLIKWLIGIGDVIVFNIVFYLVYRMTHTYELPGFYWKFRILILLLNFSYIFALYFVPVNIHKSVIYADKVVQYSLSLGAMHAILFITFIFFLKLGEPYFPIRFLFYFYLSLFCIFVIWRLLAREALKHYRRSGKNYKRVIIIGAGKNGMDLYSEMTKGLDYGFHVYGFFDDNLSLKKTLSNYLGPTHEVEDFVRQHDIDEIYCTLPHSQDEKIVRIFNFAEKHMVRFYIIPEFSRYVKKRLTLESIESLPVMAVRNEPMQAFHNRVIKRACDIVFSTIFLLTIFPVLYVIFGILIKISSPGPIIFKQTRTGIYGQDFDCYKFRSMRVNDLADKKQAEKHDPRITKIGYFLRRSNLDELPQFFNVWKGDMSVVGPRPHMLKHK
ncbi:MAG: exopolysaccharide biosynthesis polyprenyl glycosylphosphotransferase, partial [Dysgonamonadaceae bacterium]|nr:exopolysaccharide biosynthesis polyprenyl glycosylphosphotransferase [Dysgonamonadaceae bacterium]